MAFEIIDNAVDEAQAGFASHVELVLNGDGSVTVRDDGRGIPTDIHAEEGISAAEVVLTRLHAGGKFNQNSYKVAGGLHGVGAAVVNALSEWMEVRIWRHGIEHLIRFSNGDAEAPLAVVGPARPRKRHRGDLQAEPGHLHPHRVRLCAAGAAAARIGVPELRPRPSCCATNAMRRRSRACMRYDGGLVAFVEWLDRGKTAVFTPPISLRAADEALGIRVEFALSWNDSFHETMLCFTNNIPQRDGGTHLAGLPPGADPRGDEIRRGHGQEGQSAARRRGHARGHDRGAVGEGAGPEVLLADQGQAGVAPRCSRWCRRRWPMPCRTGSRRIPRRPKASSRR